jgi:ankyrin repeat protein
MAARARIQYMQHGPGPSNRPSQPSYPYVADDLAANAMRFENIQASGNSRQQNGHHYNHTTNNYTTATPYIDVTIQPRKHPIHADLIRACRQGQGPQRLGFLLSKGADIDHRDEDQWTPVHHAAASGSVLTLEYLVDTGGDIHAFGERVGTPLHCAASSGSADTVRCLLHAGADVRVSDQWIGTPLHHAAFSGSPEAVRCLLDSGADVNAFGKWVGTPLSIAAARSHLAVVEALLEHNADVNKECGPFGSAAHMACASGDMGVLGLLQRNRADFDGRAGTCYAFYRDILEPTRSSLSNSLSFRASTGDIIIDGHAVILAIVHGSLKAAEFCLDLERDGCDFLSHFESWYTEDDRRSPSLVSQPSMKFAIAALDIDMLRLLLGRGIPPDPSPDFYDPPLFDLGVSQTRRAAQNGLNASDCISILLQHGVRNSCLVTSQPGRDTLLMSIMRRKHDHLSYQVAKAVLKHGAPVNASNSQGQTAVMIAAKTDHRSRVKCVELLCDYGADVDLEDENRRTALRYAEKWGGADDFVEVKRILQHASQRERKNPLPSSRQQSEAPAIARNSRPRYDHQHT